MSCELSKLFAHDTTVDYGMVTLSVILGSFAALGIFFLWRDLTPSQ